jgi:GNAT superfamily N-acetyltransferase
MLDPNEPTHAALAWADGKAVGMVHFIYHRSNWAIENSCYLQDLLVVPETRGTGVGRQLIEFVYATAKADGCNKVHWLTHETNATAIQLYERIAERPGFIQFRKAI